MNKDKSSKCLFVQMKKKKLNIIDKIEINDEN